MASVAGLDSSDEITQKICEKYSRRLAALTASLKDIGFDAVMPQGSFYLYVGIPKATASGITFSSGEDFSQWLIREKLISTVPWDDAGNYVRFSATFVAEDKADEARVLNEVKSRLSDETFVF